MVFEVGTDQITWLEQCEHKNDKKETREEILERVRHPKNE